METDPFLSKLFMSTVSVYPVFSHLWKTPVEKAVENVEKCEFSTGIRPVSVSGPSCGKVCINDCIHTGSGGCATCYVNGYPNRFLR